MLLPSFLPAGKAFPTVGAATTYNSGASMSGTVSLAKPGSVSEGDLLVAVLAHSHTDNFPTTPPAGWTTLWEEDPAGANSLPSGVYWKHVGGSEPTSYDWTLAASTKYPVGLMFPVYGARGYSPIVASSGPTDDWASEGQSLISDCPSIVTPSEKSLIIRGGVVYVGQRGLSLDAATEIGNLTSTGSTSDYAELIVGYETQAQAGATGTSGLTAANSGPMPYWSNFTFAIAPK